MSFQSRIDRRKSRADDATTTSKDLTTTMAARSTEEYLEFVENVLRPDLKKALQAEEVTKQEIRDYEDLGEKLATLQASSFSLLPLVDLGHEKVFCKAQVQDTSLVFVHVGMGFHVQLSHDEAIVYVKRRIKLLNDVLAFKTKQTQKIRDHIQSFQNILDQLSKSH